MFQKKERAIFKRQDFSAPGVTAADLIWNMDLPEDIFEIGTCVYKLHYGEKYLIVKAGGSLQGSISSLHKEYAYFVAHNYEKAVKKASRYYTWYKYIRHNPGPTFRIEIILETDKMYQLLITEQTLLNNSFGKDDNCLNNEPDAILAKKLNKGVRLAFLKARKRGIV